MTIRWKRTFPLALGAAGGLALALALSGANAQTPPFGGDDDVAYAKTLWQLMEQAHLVGDGAIRVRPFAGNEPHGTIQEVLATTASVNGHTGRLIVKRNHGGKDGLSVGEVYDDPTKYLAAITVMFKREAGYDADNRDWFWAKFSPDGTLDKNPKGAMLAGRVAKGADAGCIACHTSAGGEDLEVLTTR
ncbi:MAG TPA: cytochrome P460 family protein [Hyphomicrobiales bacterium]|nr:cytochrome P460 family protein [Rhodobiaceae bacterium]HXK54553.1 cytochrome P460 family protein [Hyphomicrobiales bacterium]